MLPPKKCPLQLFSVLAAPKCAGIGTGIAQGRLKTRGSKRALDRSLTVLKVEDASLARVLELGASLAQLGALDAPLGSRLPAEH